MNREFNPFGYYHGYVAMAYAVPEPAVERDRPWWPYRPQPGVVWSPLSPEDRARLGRIEEKLDELLRRGAPGADVVEEIRRRVNDALDKIGRKP